MSAACARLAAQAFHISGRSVGCMHKVTLPSNQCRQPNVLATKLADRYRAGVVEPNMDIPRKQTLLFEGWSASIKGPY